VRCVGPAVVRRSNAQVGSRTGGLFFSRSPGAPQGATAIRFDSASSGFYNPARQRVLPKGTMRLVLRSSPSADGCFPKACNGRSPGGSDPSGTPCWASAAKIVLMGSLLVVLPWSDLRAEGELLPQHRRIADKTCVEWPSTFGWVGERCAARARQREPSAEFLVFGSVVRLEGTRPGREQEAPCALRGAIASRGSDIDRSAARHDDRDAREDVADGSRTGSRSRLESWWTDLRFHGSAGTSGVCDAPERTATSESRARAHRRGAPPAGGVRIACGVGALAPRSCAQGSRRS
jgi:hypothetical protein